MQNHASLDAPPLNRAEGRFNETVTVCSFDRKAGYLSHEIGQKWNENGLDVGLHQSDFDKLNQSLRDSFFCQSNHQIPTQKLGHPIDKRNIACYNYAVDIMVY